MVHTVADLCTQHAITLKDLVDRSGLEQGRVVAIVMGRWTPTPRERSQIAEIFGLSKDDIAWGHSTPIQHIYGHGPG